MRRRQTAGSDANARPAWLTHAVGDVWSRADWARWDQRVLPALEARGVTPDMLQPVYGSGEDELLGIGVEAEVGWRVGWLGQPRRRRAAVMRAASDLVQSLDSPNAGVTRSPKAVTLAGAWFRSR